MTGAWHLVRACARTSAALSAAILIAGCGASAPPSTGAAGATTASPTSRSDRVTPTSGRSVTDPGSLPTAVFVTEPNPGDPSSTVISRLQLVKLLSERLTDGNATVVQTVVCKDDLALTPGSSVECVASVQSSSRVSETSWTTIPAHNVDGSHAVLILRGASLDPKFVRLIGTPGTWVTLATIDAGAMPQLSRGTDLKPVVTAELDRVHANATVRSCADGLRFDTFKPGSCEIVSGTAVGHMTVLPVLSSSGELSLVLVTQPPGAPQARAR